MKKLRNNIWFWLGLILISVAIAGGIIFYLTKHFGRVKAPTSTTTSTPTSDEKITTPDVADMRQEVPVPILMYHHIRVYNDSNDSIGTGLSVPPNQFQEEMNYLRDNNFTTINFFDFVNFPASNLPDKPVIVTFDDGYQDAFDNAMPILKMNNQNGVFYIISGFLGRPDFKKNCPMNY
ncbi:MAG: polysaccharide deacetylase family protein [Candidatus Berkelbacteria bacterium]|nr:polysaccharide deacetylase family protein [Candidatus Berkelbacteria bacterium]